MTKKTLPEQRLNSTNLVCLLSQTLMLVLACLISAASTAPPTWAQSPGRRASNSYRMAMSAAFVSQDGVALYRNLAAWLSGKLGRQIELIDGLSYEPINQMLESGAVDMAFICGYPYVLLQEQPKKSVELLVAPIPSSLRYGGKPKYFSDLIVKSNSPYKRLADLRGKNYAYNEEISNSGYNMARFRLGTLGKDRGFFARVSRSGSHEESIRMVAKGQADASYVDSLVLEFEQALRIPESLNVRVIDSVGPAGIVPAVVSLKMPAQDRQRLRHLLLHMHEDPEGKAILKAMMLKRFDSVADSNYDDIRQMKAAARKGRFMDIRGAER